MLKKAIGLCVAVLFFCTDARDQVAIKVEFELGDTPFSYRSEFDELKWARCSVSEDRTTFAIKDLDKTLILEDSFYERMRKLEDACTLMRDVSDHVDAPSCKVVVEVTKDGTSVSYTLEGHQEYIRVAMAEVEFFRTMHLVLLREGELSKHSAWRFMNLRTGLFDEKEQYRIELPADAEEVKYSK